MFAATACTAVGTEPAAPTPTGPVVRIGTGPEAEARLLAAITAELAAAEGFHPEVVERADGAAARQALEIGDVDVLPGYTGQTWLEELGLPDPPGDPRTSFARVAAVDASNDVEWLRPRFELEAGVQGPPADATFGLFVRGFPSAHADLFTITQLATRLAEEPTAEVCVDREFATREDGWQALADAYSIGPRPLTHAGPTEAVRGVVAGACLVGLGAATEGEAWASGLRLLADPLEVFPAFVVSLQLREEVTEDHPQLVTALRPLPEHLTTALLGRWNGQVPPGASSAEVAEVAVPAAEVLRDRAGRVASAPDPTE